MVTTIKIKTLKLLQYLQNRKNPNLFKRLKYEPIVDDSKIMILGPKVGASSIIAALDRVVVSASLGKNPYRFTLYPDYQHPAIHFSIELNNTTFPGLISGSKIANVLLLRYMRNINSKNKVKSWRCVVITDKCQVYHNFPSKGDDLYHFSYSDINVFSESVIWDLPGRKFPSKDINHDVFEKYYPGLPEECYEHHPAVSEKGFSDHIKISFCGTEQVLSRFYFHKRCIECNPFVFMGGYTNDYQMTVIGTYRSNIEVGARTCVFFSSDGGRQWYNRYEFGDLGDYEYVHDERGYKVSNWGNAINTPVSADNNDELYLYQRIIDINDDKPIRFKEVAKVNHISQKGTITVETKERHNLKDGNIVILLDKKESGLHWFAQDDLCNDRLFKVQRCNDYTISLYEYVGNPDNYICCRHIHHINRQKDGWLIGTGEIFPNGWLLYFQQKECDYFNKCACNALAPIECYCLTTKPSCVQRTMGGEIIDEDLIVFASDHPTLKRPKKKYGACEISSSSTGIYIGNISDLNDFDNYKCIFNSKEVGYFFRKIENLYVFGGQLGEVAISLDKCNTWEEYHLNKALRCYMGCMNNACVIDSFVIVKK